jgi:hypothetical protein
MKAAPVIIQLLFIVFLVSCNNKNETPAVNGDTTKNDSASFIDPENIPNPYAPIDVSPMDMSYFPVDYPKLKMTGDIGTPPVIRLIYSRPHLQGRKLFQNLLKYGEPWRLGANEATEIEFYRDVSIQGKKIPAGRYVLYSIPEENKWTIVLNTNIDTWGLKIDASKDLQRFEIPVAHNNPRLEYLTMIFERTNFGAELIIGWDDVLGRLPIEFGY